MKKLSEYTKDKNLNQIMDKIVEKEMDKTFNEGIDFDPETKTVAYNSSHENYVDISIDNKKGHNKMRYLPFCYVLYLVLNYIIQICNCLCSWQRRNQRRIKKRSILYRPGPAMRSINAPSPICDG